MYERNGFKEYESNKFVYEPVNKGRHASEIIKQNEGKKNIVETNVGVGTEDLDGNIEGTEVKPWKQKVRKLQQLRKKQMRKQPKEGDTLELPPQIKGGLPRKMTFTDGTWMQQVGKDVSKVSDAVQKQAQRNI